MNKEKIYGAIIIGGGILSAAYFFDQARPTFNPEAKKYINIGITIALAYAIYYHLDKKLANS